MSAVKVFITNYKNSVGAVDTYADLPQNKSDFVSKGLIEPNDGDIITVLIDETQGGREVSYTIKIAEDGTVTYISPKVQKNYQEQTNIAQIGQVLVGGNPVGTFGIKPVDNIVTQNSNNLITSGAVFSSYNNLKNYTDSKIAEIEISSGLEFQDLPSDSKPVGQGQSGIIYVQPNGIMWGWSTSQQDYIQINGLTDLTSINTAISNLQSDVANLNTNLSNFIVKINTPLIVYANDNYGNPIGIKYTVIPDINTIPLRDTSGNIQVQPNVTGNNAIGASQVNSLISQSTGTFQSDINNLNSEIDLIENAITAMNTAIASAIELDHQVVDTEYQTQVNTPIDKNTTEQLVTATELSKHSERDLTMISYTFNTLNNTIGNLQNQILDIKSTIDNKKLDSNSVDIKNITYNVNNSLGGRISGIGYVLLGVLSIRLVSTGIIDITSNTETTNVYDNTSLLTVGAAQPITLDVNNGDIIVSSGMDSLIFTPYIPA